VQTTLWGNLILGPTARDVGNPQHDLTKDQCNSFILSKCKQLVDAFDASQAFHAFAGARAKSSRKLPDGSDECDWIIEPCRTQPRMIHAAGIDSPGLAGSPAIAAEVVRLLTCAGLVLRPNPSFDGKRYPLVMPKKRVKGITYGPNGNKLVQDADMEGKPTAASDNVICKCEKVTEAEVIAACHRALPIDSTQAIRKRTRAGMGNCQGKGTPCDGYDCERRVAAIIARETGLPVAAVGRRPWPATSTLPQRWLAPEDKEKLKTLSLQCA